MCQFFYRYRLWKFRFSYTCQGDTTSLLRYIFNRWSHLHNTFHLSIQSCPQSCAKCVFSSYRRLRFMYICIFHTVHTCLCTITSGQYKKRILIITDRRFCVFLFFFFLMDISCKRRRAWADDGESLAWRLGDDPGPALCTFCISANRSYR